MYTAHELAKKLLSMPDAPVFILAIKQGSLYIKEIKICECEKEILIETT